MALIPCYRCSTEFECKARNPTPFCKVCRVKINREKARDRRANKELIIQRVIESLPDSPSILLAGRQEDLIAALQDKVTTVQDRQPEGWRSPAGSDDGRSTYFKDLAGEIDTLCAESAAHPWWDENPHWALGL